MCDHRAGGRLVLADPHAGSRPSVSPAVTGGMKSSCRLP
jgi:hypothetical protein